MLPMAELPSSSKISKTRLLDDIKLAMADFFLTEDTANLLEHLYVAKGLATFQFARVFQLIPAISLREINVPKPTYEYNMVINFSPTKDRITVSIRKIPKNATDNENRLLGKQLTSNSVGTTKYEKFLIDCIEDLEDCYFRYQPHS